MTVFDEKKNDTNESGIKTTVIEGGALNPNSERVEDRKQPLLVMDGPLSEIYTKALNVVYAKSVDEVVARESQSIDAVILDHVISDDEKNKLAELGKTRDLSYVYVSDGDNLDDESLLRAFDSVGTAKDTGLFREVRGVIESSGAATSRSSMFDQYLATEGIKAHYKRSVAIENIHNLIEYKPCQASRKFLIEF